MESIKRFRKLRILTCESMFINAVNFVVIKLKNTKIWKTRDAVCRYTCDLIV